MRNKIILLSCLLCLSINPVRSQEKPVLQLTIEPTIEAQGWHIGYQFSEAVNALNFETTPYGFLSSDWVIDQSMASFDFSKLYLNLAKPSKDLRIAIKGSNDQFFNGFYTPFLNFSDGGAAVYVGHYLPKSVKLADGWVALEDIALQISIEPEQDANVLFAGESQIKHMALTAATAKQYAYIGPQKPQIHRGFSVLMDKQLPEWIQQQYQQALPQLFNFFQKGFKAELTFKPLFIVNFKGSSKNTRLDGGAINQQIAINYIGNGWIDGESKNRINILSLLAHEMSHLWNSQHWQSADSATKPWLHEGSANYFAYQALLGSGMISPEQFRLHQEQQIDNCQRALQNAPINQFKDRRNVYACGEVLFGLANGLTGSTNPFGFWHEMNHSQSDKTYSQNQFINSINQVTKDKSKAETLLNILDNTTTDNTAAFKEFLPLQE